MIYATTLACGIGLALIVYRYDMWEKEPWYLLLLAVLGGGLAAWGLSYGEDWVAEFGGDAAYRPAGQASIAAISEEASKLLVVIAVAIVFRPHFNDPLDGIIYGAFAGAGFGIAESWLYVSLAAPTSAIELTRLCPQVVRLALHLLTGAMIGFACGLFRFPLSGGPRLMLAYAAAALGIHFLWDFACGQSIVGSPTLLARAIAVGLMLASTVLFGTAVLIASHASRARHAPNCPRRVWGWPFS